jgi:hypothetical protein
MLFRSPLRLLCLRGINPTGTAGSGRLNARGRVGGWRESLEAGLETRLLGVILAFHGSGAGVGIQTVTRRGGGGETVRQGGGIAPITVVVGVRVGMGRGTISSGVVASSSRDGSATLGTPGDLAGTPDDILVF